MSLFCHFMEQGDIGEIDFLAARIETVHATSEGTFIELGIISNLERQEQKEILADAWGVEPEQIIEAGSREHSIGRIAVGFRRWRSSWDPRGPTADPTLN